jgi:hypothetical protein
VEIKANRRVKKPETLRKKENEDLALYPAA